MLTYQVIYYIMLVVPGYHGSNQDVNFLEREADKMGYPVLIKAVKGGGGKVFT